MAENRQANQEEPKPEAPLQAHDVWREEGEVSTFGTRLEDLVKKPRRHPAIHWAALILSLISLAPLFMWVIWRAEISYNWYWLDIIFSVFFAVEFVTRSGFRWDPSGYMVSHVFDFVAIVPALVLIHYNVPFFHVYVWVILVARVIRALDRILGDGFIRRNALALASGFEEEITDRVMMRILDRVHEDLEQGRYARSIGAVLEGNRQAMLERLHQQHPNSIKSGIAKVFGVEKKLIKAEEDTYKALINVLNSPEVDRILHESIDSTFATLRKGVAEKSWRKKIGFRRSDGDTR
jgi:hypothetical protein